MQHYGLQRLVQGMIKNFPAQVPLEGKHLTFTIPLLMVLGTITAATGLVQLRWPKVGTAVLVMVAVFSLLIVIFGGQTSAKGSCGSGQRGAASTGPIRTIRR
jgi:hypothetical protein